MIKHRTTKRVRYGETDQMGYLYYGNYALYYEIGRVELLRSLGLTYKTMEEQWQVMMPVINMNARYLRPARYDELINIETTIRTLPDQEIVFNFELYNPDGKLINSGRVSLCFLDMKSNTRLACPEPILQVLNPHFA